MIRVHGAIVIAGDEHAPAVAEVVDIVEKAAGPVVHLRVLPGLAEDYEALPSGRPSPVKLTLGYLFPSSSKS